MAHEIGATLTLRDNMSATLRGVRNEQTAFRRDVAATQRQLRQEMQIRMDATAATRAISRVRTAIEPLRSRIVTYIAIRDNAARERRRIRNEMNSLGRQAIAPLVSIRDSASRVIGSIGSKLAALRTAAAVPMVIGAVAVAGGAAAVKSGAMLEQQEISMKHFIGVNNQGKSDAEVTSMRDSYIKDLRKNADATPFSTSEVIGAGSRAVNVMGGDTKGAMELTKLAGDMAALNPGKTIMDSMEALADAKNGEFERMKEFGFKISAEEFKGYVGKGKNDDLSSAETMTAYQMLVNKQLNPYFKGGSEKLSQSGTGLMSTITGNLGSKVQDTGRQMLERLKPTLISVIGLIDKYSPQMDKFGLKIADGIGFAVSKLPTLKQWLKDAFETSRPVISWVSDTGIPKVRDILGSVLDKATSVYKFFKDNWSTIGPLVTGIAIAFGAYKAVMLAAQGVTIALTAVQLALNLAMNANPIGLIITGIGLLIGAGILLYQNWDTVKEKIDNAWVTIKNTFAKGANVVIDIFNKVRDVMGLPMIARVEMSYYKNASNATTLDDRLGNVGRNASGTDYWRGGPTWVGEEGPEILNLPSGSKITPNNKIPSNGGKSISIAKLADTIIVREEADIDKIVDRIIIRIDAAAENM